MKKHEAAERHNELARAGDVEAVLSAEQPPQITAAEMAEHIRKTSPCKVYASACINAEHGTVATFEVTQKEAISELESFGDTPTDATLRDGGHTVWL